MIDVFPQLFSERTGDCRAQVLTVLRRVEGAFRQAEVFGPGGKVFHLGGGV